MLITSELTNQNARKALLTCEVYTNWSYRLQFEIALYVAFWYYTRARLYMVMYEWTNAAQLRDVKQEVIDWTETDFEVQS